MANKIEPYRKGIRPRTIDELFDDMQRSFEDMMWPFLPASRWPSFGELESVTGRLPHADVEETEKEYRITADMPGIPKENIEVKLSEGNVVEIAGRSSSEKEESKGKYLRQERSSTDFYRRFALESEVDEEKVEARMENGVLTLTLPKKTVEPSKVHKVPVK